jgi:hypothetical protein
MFFLENFVSLKNPFIYRNLIQLKWIQHSITFHLNLHLKIGRRNLLDHRFCILLKQISKIHDLAQSWASTDPSSTSTDSSSSSTDSSSSSTDSSSSSTDSSSSSTDPSSTTTDPLRASTSGILPSSDLFNVLFYLFIYEDFLLIWKNWISMKRGSNDGR